MRFKGYTRAVFALSLCCAGLYGQNVASSLVGMVVNPAGAVVADAPVTLTNADTLAVRLATTDTRGMYRFPDIDPGNYNVTVRATGFKAEIQTGIVVLAEETHNGGKMVLQSGLVTEFNTVIAAPAQLQVGSSGKTFTIDEQDLENLPQKGRDLFGYMRLIPGIVDTRPSRDVTSSDSIQGITIDGNTSAINFTVDGITDLDTGTNQRVHVEPNLDTIREIRVLEANYQAEYGRNSGGVITVVTRSGARDFHGTANWNHRNEEFNANSWANNHTLTPGGSAEPRPAYRFNIETYGIGGPVFIPKVANQDRKKLFFFFSQERTAQALPAQTQITYMPTTAERGGDFSQTFTNVNGNAVALPILDPANNNTQFAGNIIPVSRLNPVGEGLLQFFPTPNFTPTLSNQLYVDNYFEQGSDKYSRRNDLLRIDSVITSKVSAYVRWMDDKSSLTELFKGVQFNQVSGTGVLSSAISPISHLNPGHGYLGTITDAISPTLVNEFSGGQSWNQFGFYTTDNYGTEQRGLEPALPMLFPIPATTVNKEVVSKTNTYKALLPTFTFGGSGLPASAYYLRNAASAGADEQFNTIWTLKDSVTKIWGHHIIKGGFYGERNTRLQPAGQNYNGAFNFAASTSVPFLNTNDGYVNALLGDVNSYSQYTAATTSDALYYNAEFYVQDNWKVNRRLTLDFGIRFYHQTPPIDHDKTFVNFVPADYSASAMSRLYYPYCANGLATCSSAANGLVARDRLTGATVGSGYIGDIVYGSGNPVTGMVNLGVGGASADPYQLPGLSYGPRFGFAWDLFGNGKTAIRGGGGLYYDRLAGNTVYGLGGQAPLSYQQTVTNVTFAQIATADNGAVPPITNVTFAPVAPNSWPSTVPGQAVANGSLGVQHLFGRSMVLDVGYTLNYSYNQYLTYDLNYIPIGTSWPFTPSNLNPTTSGNTSADIGSIYERKFYPGYGEINRAGFQGTSNYNAVTASFTRRVSHGLAAGVAYTWSQALGITTYSPEVANNRSYNYGRLPFDRRHNLQISYVYNIPDIATKYGMKKVGYVTDHWQLSGITSVQSGAPYDPTCSVTAGQPAPETYTGTPDLAARCNVLGNPLTGTGSNGNGTVYFRASAFALPALATGPNNSLVGSPVLGNLGGGAGVLSLPHTTNFDMTLTKSIPILGSEKHILKLQVQAYNVFNHTEVSGINTGIQFNPATNVVSNPSAVGYMNAALPNRVLAFTARLVF